MKKIVFTMLTVITMLFVSPTVASAAPLTPGVHFTTPDATGGPDCSWSHLTGCTYINSQVAMLDDVPKWTGKGERPQAWVSLYSSNQPRLTDAAFRADKRGVSVHLITWFGKSKEKGADPDGDPPTGERKRFIDGLKSSDHSTATACKGSCFANGSSGRMHAKVMATYDPYSKSYRWMSASGNSVLWTDNDAWNDFYIGTDKAHYNQIANYLKLAAKDKKQKTPKPVTSASVTLTLYPYGGDPFYSHLKAVKVKNGCTVRVDMWQASNSSAVNKNVDQLIRIKKAHGYVRVIADSTVDPGGTPNWSAKIIKRMQKAGIVVLDGRGSKGQYVNHEKSVSVAGCAKGDGDSRGSANFKRGKTNMENQIWRAGTSAGRQGVDRDDQIAKYSKTW